jgi:hypothetical protein
VTSLFAIGFLGRQGSSYLEGLLNSHPDAQCLGEIIALKDPSEEIAPYLRRTVHNVDVASSGFKLPLLHLQGNPELLPFLKENDYKIIILSRENKLDQLVSFILAGSNNSWRSDFGEYKTNSIVVNAADFESYVKVSYEADAELERTLAGLPTMHMTYEELISPHGYMPALDFLNLRKVELNSPFNRQRKGSQRDVILNYDELVRHFSGTELSKYFT